jgi:hypothetical protein
MKYMFDLFSAEVFLLEKEKNDKQNNYHTAGGR